MLGAEEPIVTHPVEAVDQDLPLGTRIMAKYTLLGKLTQGGMAEVYLAQATGPGGFQKLCVVKRVRPHLANDPDFIAMFTNEARLAAKITHANVVKIFDLGQGGPAGADWFLTMEYLDGRDMLQIGRACRAHNKAVPFDVTARIISDACAGLDFAHQLRGEDGVHLNLVHRDMSPENIVITFDGEVKVVDFGIAKAADNAVRTQAGQIKGKLGYVAPEAILGKPLDARADIFAVGATLYLFLCGRPAFTGNNPMEVFERSLQPPMPPSTVNSRVPEALDRVCMRCLAQDPDKRYATAAELRTSLEEYLSSTGRPLGRPQLAQFMRILFPPGRDPQRTRVDDLVRQGQGLLEPHEGLNYGDHDATMNRAPMDTEAMAAPVSMSPAPAEVSGLVPNVASYEATAIVDRDATHAPPPIDFRSDDRTAVGDRAAIASGSPFSEDSDPDATREVDATLMRELNSVLDDSFEPTPPPMPDDDEEDDFGLDIDFEETLQAARPATAAPPPSIRDDGESEEPTMMIEGLDETELPPLADDDDGDSFSDTAGVPIDDSMELESTIDRGPPLAVDVDLDLDMDMDPPEITHPGVPPPPPESTNADSMLIPAVPSTSTSGYGGIARGMAFVIGGLVGVIALGGALYALGWLEPSLRFLGLR